jgi:hypothetical protein
MVSKVTIFEPHFDGAQFGPASIPGEMVDVDSPGPITGEEEREKGPRGVSPRSAVLVGGLVLGILVGVKTLRSRETDESEPVTNEEQPAEAVPAE